MSTPSIHPLEPRGATGQRLRFTHGLCVMDVDTSVEHGEVAITQETIEHDGRRVYHRWNGTLAQAVGMLLAADQARRVLNAAHR